MFGLLTKNRLSIIEAYSFKLVLNIENIAQILRGCSGSPAFSEDSIIAILNGGLHKEDTGRIITFNMVDDLQSWGENYLVIHLNHSSL
jgi:hypothetical protein